MGVKGRTVREFTAGPEVWDILDRWAQDTGYRLIEQDQSSRLYERGTGLLVAQQRLKLTFLGNAYRLEAWVYVNLFNRIFTLMLMPEELVIDSGGSWGRSPATRHASKSTDYCRRWANRP
ncbi:MAG: hypothetical protein H5T73_12765 [Actinobacteria bacterium]|nr:hypothetical protein [Actinomycetota bacterium]